MLTEEFRLDYCRLWQSLICTDMKRVKKYSQRLGAGDLYPLFACMLTARSWNSVSRGISETPVTATEVGFPSWPCPLRNTRGLWTPGNPGSGVLDWGGEAEVEMHWMRGREGAEAVSLGGRRERSDGPLLALSPWGVNRPW